MVPSISWSEVIVLVSGQEVEGKIIYQDKHCLRLDVGLQSSITYFFDEIKQILPDKVGRGFKPSPTLVSLSSKDRADQLEKQAIDVTDAGRMDEGLKLMRKAIELDPTPMRHMNYGSILFGQGVSLFQGGNQTQAVVILHKAEGELSQAIVSFNPKREKVFLSQAYFLLGEIYLNAFADKIKAKFFYQKAKTYYKNEAAKSELEKLE